MRPRLVPAVLLGAALLAGCGADDSKPVVGGTSASPTGTSTDPSASGDPNVDESPPTAAPDEPTSVQFRVVRASGNSQARTTDLGNLRDEFADLNCETAPPPVQVPAQEPQVSCDPQQVRYLLEPAALEAVVEAAEVAVDESGNPLLTLTLDPAAAAELADVTTELADSRTKLAVVVNGSVVTAPVVAAPIENGVLQIAGGFTETEAEDLVKRLTAGE